MRDSIGRGPWVSATSRFTLALYTNKGHGHTNHNAVLARAI